MSNDIPYNYYFLPVSFFSFCHQEIAAAADITVVAM